MRFSYIYIARSFYAYIKRALMSAFFVRTGSALFDIAVFSVISGLFEVPYMIAQAVSYISYAVIRYGTHSVVKLRRTFTVKILAREFPKFIVLSSAILFLSLILTFILRGVLFWNIFVSKLVVTGFTAASNSLLYGKGIFKTD